MRFRGVTRTAIVLLLLGSSAQAATYVNTRISVTQNTSDGNLRWLVTLLNQAVVGSDPFTEICPVGLGCARAVFWDESLVPTDDPFLQALSEGGGIGVSLGRPEIVLDVQFDANVIFGGYIKGNDGAWEMQRLDISDILSLPSSSPSGSSRASILAHEIAEAGIASDPPVFGGLGFERDHKAGIRAENIVRASQGNTQRDTEARNRLIIAPPIGTTVEHSQQGALGDVFRILSDGTAELLFPLIINNATPAWEVYRLHRTSPDGGQIHLTVSDIIPQDGGFFPYSFSSNEIAFDQPIIVETVFIVPEPTTCGMAMIATLCMVVGRGSRIRRIPEAGLVGLRKLESRKKRGTGVGQRLS